MTDPLGRWTETDYDSAGRVEVVRTSAGAQQTYRYDADGRVAEGTEDAPVKEDVSFVFSRVTWTHVPGRKEFADSWRERTGS